MPNSIDFYKRIFLRVMCARIIVPCYSRYYYYFFFTLSTHLIITIDIINIMILIMKDCSTYRVNASNLSFIYVLYFVIPVLVRVLATSLSLLCRAD